MAVAMPPQQVVEYRVETVRASGPDAVMAQARRFVSAQRAAAEQAPSAEQRSATAASLPRLDLASRAISQKDRQDLASVAGSSTYGVSGTVQAAAPSNSYVGERIALAKRMNGMSASLERGEALSQQEAKDFRCSIVRIAMDKRAGAYVQGGEKAAAAMRASVPAADVENCKPTSLREQMAGLKAQGATTRVDPRSGPDRTASPVEVSPRTGHEARAAVNPGGIRAQAQKFAFDPPARKRVELDFKPEKRTFVDLKGPAKPVEVDLVAFAGLKGRDAGR